MDGQQAERPEADDCAAGGGIGFGCGGADLGIGEIKEIILVTTNETINL